MVPIHDTDIARERWLRGEWENYELWERVELRLRRQKRLWILSTVLIFLVLSAIPITVDRWPKWVTRSYARFLAQEMSRMKRDAGVDHKAYRIRILPDGKFNLAIEQVANCSDKDGVATRILDLDRISDFGKKQELAGEGPREYRFLTPEIADQLGIPGITDQFCYDYLTGSAATSQGRPLTGFGIIPASDIEEGRTDRLTVLLISGPSGELTFD